MKKIIFTTLACILILVIQAQNETRCDSTEVGILKFGINHAKINLHSAVRLFDHVENLEIFYVEYTYPINRFVGITPRAFGGGWLETSPRRFEEVLHTSHSTIGASLAVTFQPFKWVTLNAGVVYLNLATVSGFSGENSYYYEKNKEDYKGLFTSVSFPIINTSKIQAGTRFEVIVGKDIWQHYHKNSLQGGIYLGVKM